LELCRLELVAPFILFKIETKTVLLFYYFFEKWKRKRAEKLFFWTLIKVRISKMLSSSSGKISCASPRQCGWSPSAGLSQSVSIYFFLVSERISVNSQWKWCLFA
jgi:hypothetical protein